MRIAPSRFVMRPMATVCCPWLTRSRCPAIQRSSSSALARSVADERYSPSQYNLYLFYASDGENSPSDSAATDVALKELLGDLQYCGFLEVGSGGEGGPSSDIGKLFLQLAADGQPTAAYRAAKADDIWGAVRHFFGQQQAA